MDILRPEIERARKPELWQTIDKIASVLDWNIPDLSNHLEMTPLEIEQLRLQNAPPPASSCLLLANHLGVGIEGLLAGTIDLKVLRGQVRGDPDALPERYSVGAFSRRRTSLHLIDYCDRHLGVPFSDQMLRALQLRRAAFTDPDAMICMNAPVDLANYIGNSLGSRKFLFLAGANSLHVNQNSPFAAAIRSRGNLREAYESLIVELMPFFDANNHHYSIVSSSDTHCTFESHCTTTLLDTLKQLRVGSTFTCSTRAGVAAAVAGFLGAPLPNVKETTCQHRGDKVCRFHVDFSFGEAFLKRRIRRPS